MTYTPDRVRQRLLLMTLIVLTAVGGSAAAAQSVSPSPAASPSPVSTEPTLEDQLAEAQAQIRELTARQEHLQALLDGFNDLYDPLEADRQLLLELRKPLPAERADTEVYLERIGRLAVIADAARLGQPASRVKETAPTYLDWRDQTFATQSEADQAFLSSGAAGFGASFDDLKDAILLTVSNRLDALLTLRDRIR